MSVYLKDSKVMLNDSGSVATSEDCCCHGDLEGACCHTDGTCTLETAESCDGDYQGNDTVCEDFDCTNTGACCSADGSCDITTEGRCTGVYQGAGTVCEPNPCPQPCGACFYANPCNGKHYKTYQVSGSGTWFTDYDDGRFSHYSVDAGSTHTYNLACGEDCTASGSGTWDNDDGDHCDYTWTDCSGGPTRWFEQLAGIPYTTTTGGFCPLDPPETVPSSETCDDTVWTQEWNFFIPSLGNEVTITGTKVITFSDECTSE